jgi:tRNA U34 5-carboxymethylaminomethyl modifying GTPase MnmE/TrmE
MTSLIADAKAQLGEAFKRTEDVTGTLESALTMIEEVQAIVLAATDGSANRAVEQLTGALIEARDTIQQSMATLGAAIQEGRDYSEAL